MEPYYLALGMTHEQYWEEDTWLTVVYQKAYDIRREMRNQEMWLQGFYITQGFNAGLSNFAQAFSKKRNPPEKYIQQPIRVTPLSEKEKREKIIADRKKAIAYFTNLQKRWDASKK